MPVHITHVRIEPEEATVAPAAMSSVLSMTTPTNAAARPAVALRNEIRTGMSAPPMRMANTTPSSIDAAMRPRSNNCCAAPPVTALPTVSADAHGDDEQEDQVVLLEDRRLLLDLVGQLGGCDHAARERGRADDEPDVARDGPDRRELGGDTGELDEGDQQRRDAAGAVLERDQRRDLDHVDAHRHDPADDGADQERRDDDRPRTHVVGHEHEDDGEPEREGGQVIAAPRARGRAELGDAGDQDDDDRQLDDVLLQRGYLNHGPRSRPPRAST